MTHDPAGYAVDALQRTCYTNVTICWDNGQLTAITECRDREPLTTAIPSRDAATARNSLEARRLTHYLNHKTWKGAEELFERIEETRDTGYGTIYQATAGQPPNRPSATDSGRAPARHGTFAVTTHITEPRNPPAAAPAPG